MGAVISFSEFCRDQGVKVSEKISSGQAVHTANSLLIKLKGTGEVMRFRPETSAKDAIEKMCESHHWWAPVVDDKGVFRGIFSMKRFAAASAKSSLDSVRREKVVLGDLPVTEPEFLDREYEFIKPSTKLSDLKEKVSKNIALLVGDENNILAVIDSVDVLKYLHDVANPYILLLEIELAVRYLISISFPSDKLKVAIETAGLESSLALNKMTFNDYKLLLVHKSNWETVGEFVHLPRKRFESKMNTMQDLRNRIFHFRNEPSLDEYQSLADLRDWLLDTCVKDK